MKYSFEKGIQEVQKIGMTAEEKSRIYASIMAARPVRSPASIPVRSPWTVYSFNVWVRRHSIVTVLAAFLIIIIGTSGGIARAAEGAVPGEALYKIKVGVTEPIRDALAVSPEAKAEWQVEKTARRMEEAEVLAASGQLDTDKEETIAKLLDRHTDEFAVAIEEVRNEDKPDAADRADGIVVAFQAELIGSAMVLETINAHSKSGINAESEPEKAEKMSERARMNADRVSARRLAMGSEKIGPDGQTSIMSIAARSPLSAKDAQESAEDDDGDEEDIEGTPSEAAPATTSSLSVSATATEPSAATATEPASGQTGTATDLAGRSATDTAINTAINTATDTASTESPDAFTKKRASVLKMIDEARAELESASKSGSAVRVSIFEDAKRTLEEAVQYLNEADERNTKGEFERAQSDLLRAEREVREARVLINSALRISYSKKEKASASASIEPKSQTASANEGLEKDREKKKEDGKKKR